MNFIVNPYNKDYYANRLFYNKDSGELRYNSLAQVMLIQVAYEEPVNERLRDICTKLSLMQNQDIIENEYFRVKGIEDVYVYIVSKDKVSSCCCPIKEKGKTYGVFGIRVIEDNIEVFESQNSGMLHNRINIPQKLTIHIDEIMETKRSMLKTTQVRTGFYSISFPNQLESFDDGDIYYNIDDSPVNFPISKGFLETRELFVESNTIPVIKTRKKGLTISIE